MSYQVIYRGGDDGDSSEFNMKFRLYHEGKLLSTRGKVEDGQTDKKAGHKHEIRKGFHKQLRLLWQVNPFFSRQLVANPHNGKVNVDEIANRFKNNNFRWVPLAIDELRVHCSLKILCLRPNVPYVLTSGDIDNRVKTLVDALKMPTVGEMESGALPSEVEDPFFVLLQDDAMVNHLSVEADTLLSPTDTKLGDMDSRVVITVNLRPYIGTYGNLGLGG